MNSFLYHLQINIDPQNLKFYKELMTFLGWNIIFEGADMMGMKSGKNGDLWFLPKTKDIDNSHDGVGMNHLSVRVESANNIDETVEYLKENKIATLFDTPRQRPEFSTEGNTYYQVMFESPDKILFEVVYIGAKS